MGGLREERFVKSGRRTRTRDTWRGDGGETGSVTKKKEKKIDERYRCQPHPGLLGAVHIYVTSDGTWW